MQPRQEKMPLPYGCIVIGAGWAGTMAAHTLAKAGHRVLILEARERAGGRARTWFGKNSKGGVDLGCSWIHGYKEGNPAKKLAKDFGILAHLSKPVNNVVLSPEGPVPPQSVENISSKISEALDIMKDLANNSREISSSHEDPPLSELLFPSESPFCFGLDEKEKGLACTMIRNLEVPFGATLEQVSSKWFGWQDNFSGSDAAPEGGYQPFLERILTSAVAHGAELRLAAPVTAISQAPSGSVRVDSFSSAFEAQSVICTIPLGVLQAETAPVFDPPLPLKREETIKRTHVGVLEKMVLEYEIAWWPDPQITGSFTVLPGAIPHSVYDGLDESQKSVVDTFAKGVITVVSFAAPTLPNPHPTLLIYLGPTTARALLSLSFSEHSIISGAHAYLASRFYPQSPLSTPLAAPIGGVLTDWLTNKWSCGATTTPSLVGEGRSPLDFLELGKPVWEGKLGFAGEHTDPNHRGSVAGAIISGKREAKRMANFLGKDA